MRHADVPENLSVLGIISVKYPLSLTISIYKLTAIKSCSRKFASNSCLQLPRYFGGHDHKPQKDYTNLKSFMNKASAGIVGLPLSATKHFCDHI